MDYKTAHLSPETGPIQGVTERIRKFSITMMDLMALQSQLMVEDSKQAQRYIKGAGIAVLIAFTILITALPMLGFGIVELLVEQWGWQRAVASLLFGGTLTVVAGVLLLLAWKASSRAAHAFNNSRREAIANLTWIRNSIDRQSTN